MGEAREPLLALARRLGDDAVAAEVALAFDDAGAYFAKFQERCDDRGIEDADEVDPWYALIDALCERNRAAEIDWKTDADTVQWVVDKVFPGGPLGDDRWAWFLDDRYDKIKTVGLLEIAGAFVAAHGHALLELDTDGDSYVLFVVAEADVDDVQALAVQAGQGATRWTGKLPAEALAPPPSGPRIERVTFDDLPYGMCGRAHGGIVCLGTGQHGSEWLDLRVWPPKRHLWKDCWLGWASGGGPNGAWVVVDSPPAPDRRRAHYRVFVVDDPLVPYEAVARREVPFAQPAGLDPVDRAEFVGGRIVAFPWSASTSADQLHIEQDGVLVPAPDVPRAERATMGSGTTGAGTPYILWAGGSWELTPSGFVRFGPNVKGSKDTPSTAAAGDAFYAVPSEVIRVARGAHRIERPLGERHFTDAQPGPLGSVLLTQNPYDKKPALAWVWFPDKDMVIRIERKLVGIRDTHWIVWSEPIQRIVLCVGDKLFAVPVEILRTLPQIGASTGRKLRKPIAI